MIFTNGPDDFRKSSGPFVLINIPDHLWYEKKLPTQVSSKTGTKKGIRYKIMPQNIFSKKHRQIFPIGYIYKKSRIFTLCLSERYDSFIY